MHAVDISKIVFSNLYFTDINTASTLIHIQTLTTLEAKGDFHFSNIMQASQTNPSFIVVEWDSLLQIQGNASFSGIEMAAPTGILKITSLSKVDASEASNLEFINVNNSGNGPAITIQEDS